MNQKTNLYYGKTRRFSPNPSSSAYVTLSQADWVLKTQKKSSYERAFHLVGRMYFHY